MRKNTSIYKTIVVASQLILILLLASCSRFDQSKVVSVAGEVLDTTFSIQYTRERNTPAAERTQSLVITRLQEIDSILSKWDQESQLSKFNLLLPHRTMEVNQELVDILVLSKQLHQMSGGAFDITIGQLIQLWEFDSDGVATRAPDDSILSIMRNSLSISNLNINGNQLSKSAIVHLDFAEILEGYVAAELSRVLQEHKVGNHLIQVGDTMLAHGDGPNNGKWQMAIDCPDKLAGQVYKTIALNNQGMATSGNYRDYYEKEDIRYSSIIDPRTLKPIKHNLAMVTVIHQNPATADALSAALMIMGTDEALDFARQHDLAIYLISWTQKRFTGKASPQFIQLAASK